MLSPPDINIRNVYLYIQEKKEHLPSEQTLQNRRPKQTKPLNLNLVMVLKLFFFNEMVQTHTYT